MFLVITVNYNNAELTNQMVESIYQSDFEKKNVRVVVVDNNSNDKGLLKFNEFVSGIFLNENIGYFPALNKGIESVCVNEFNKIIICNNDLRFDKDFFTNLSKTDYLDNVYAICPRIIDLDGIDQNPSLDKKISRFKIFFYDMYFLNFYFGKFIYKIWQKIKKRRKPGEVDLNNRNIFLGYGAIYVLTTVFFQNNSSLDTPPFLMGEEAFLAYQIKETGGVQFFDSSLIVYHKDHSSCNNVPKQKMYFYTKDSYKFYRKKLLELPKIKD